jgi:hypothetical protein
VILIEGTAAVEATINKNTGSSPVLTTNKLKLMKGSMNLKHRKNIVREAKKLINIEIEDYNSRHIGEQESILDKYIEKICVELGWTLSNFYCEEDKVLEKILK